MAASCGAEKSGPTALLNSILKLDPVNRCMRWIRAGHDPAILYNPLSDSFTEMGGKGVALGISEQAVFEENETTGMAPGQIIVLATDGIWEACDKKGCLGSFHLL